MTSPTTIIGLEVHVQLQTQTKIFCGCANRFNPDEPNVQTCPVCLGLPGALPVMNRRALELSVRAGLALSGTIAGLTKWDRKQYYYPDLPKAYQISQYDLPFCQGGHLDVDVEQENGEIQSRHIRLIRVHLEEDAGKNLHDESGRGGDSRVDLNRAGTPLLEIVSEPDIGSAAEARRYLEEIRLLMVYLGVSDCNMQEGSLRCDANVNLEISNAANEPIRTPIVEVKNLNSFRGVEAALVHEISRQQREFEQCGGVYADTAKQTRGWDADRGVTFAQRGKEETIESFPIDAQGLASLLGMITSGDLTTRSGREVFSSLMNNQGGDGSIVERIASIVEESGLSAVADSGALETVIDAVISRNEKAADDFRGGKDAAIGKLIGEVMREVGGADPKMVRETLISRLRP